jgi:hypothetical protein
MNKKLLDTLSILAGSAFGASIVLAFTDHARLPLWLLGAILSVAAANTLLDLYRK